MKIFVATVALFFIATLGVSAQVTTIETTTTVDSAASGTTTSKSTTVKTVEEIDPPRSNMITINPLKFLLFYNLNYYRAISNTVVIGGGLQMPTISALGGFGANLEVRFHPSGKRMRGFYIAPNVSYNVFSTDYTTSNEDGTEEEHNISSTAFSIGALLGWQWFPGDDFAMGLGLGVDKYFLSASADGAPSNVFSAFTGAVAPAFRFDIGYAW